MKPAKKSAPPTLTFDAFLTDTSAFVRDINGQIKTLAAKALHLGMRLDYIRAIVKGQDNAALILEGKKAVGFRELLDQIGISRSNAYNCMSYFAKAVGWLELNLEDRPVPGTPEWSEWEDQLAAACAGCTLQRLVTSGPIATSDSHRLGELTHLAETGNAKAEELLDQINEGKITIARAWAGFQGAEVTKGKERAEPVYLAVDEEGKISGLVVKSITTLLNATKRWDGQWNKIPKAAKTELRAQWLDLVAAMPDEIKKLEL